MSTPPEYPGGDGRQAGAKMGGDGAVNAYQWEEGLPAPNDLTPMHQTLVSPLLAEAFCLPQQHHPESMHARIPDGPSTAYNSQPHQFQQEPPAGYVRSLPPQGYGPPARHRVPDPGYPGYGAAHQQAHYQGVQSHGMPPSVLMYGPSPSQFPLGQAYPVHRQDLNFATRDGPPAMPAEPPEQRHYAQYEDGGQGRHMAGSYSQEAYEGEEGGTRALKRPRLVWTPQLHKRFVDAVSHLGIKSAVPKTIMQLMNVEGLTRENVASHLQKYRLYVKRVQGGEEESAGGSSKAASPAPGSPEEKGEEGGENEGQGGKAAAVAIGGSGQEGGQNESGGAGYGSGSNVGDGGSAQGEQGGSSEGQGRGNGGAEGAEQKDQT